MLHCRSCIHPHTYSAQHITHSLQTLQCHLAHDSWIVILQKILNLWGPMVFLSKISLALFMMSSTNVSSGLTDHNMIESPISGNSLHSTCRETQTHMWIHTHFFWTSLHAQIHWLLWQLVVFWLWMNQCFQHCVSSGFYLFWIMCPQTLTTGQAKSMKVVGFKNKRNHWKALYIFYVYIPVVCHVRWWWSL